MTNPMKHHEDESKISKAKRYASVQCKCSNRVPFHVFNIKGWAVCNHCGAKILKPQDEFKSKLQELLK